MSHSRERIIHEEDISTFEKLDAFCESVQNELESLTFIYKKPHHHLALEENHHQAESLAVESNTIAAHSAVEIKICLQENQNQRLMSSLPI